VDPRRIHTALRVRRGYAAVCAGLGADVRVSAVRSARRVRPGRVEFGLGGQRARWVAVAVAACVECGSRLGWELG